MNATNTELPPPAAGGDDLKLVLPGRQNTAGAGMDWIAQGWKLFALSPLMWIVAIVIFIVLAIIMGLVPILGQLAFQVLTPVFGAGFVVACRSLERGGNFELEHLFAGFKTRFGNLAMIGLLYLVGGIVIILIMAAFVGFTILTAFMTGDPEAVVSAFVASALSIALGTLVALGLGLLLMAAIWFAPALVIMHDVAPIEAMKASFFACFRNFVPFLVYGIVMLLLAIVAAIPLGLGFLVWVPLAVTSNYAAYRQIFTE